MEINHINQMRGFLRAEQDKLRKVREIQKIEPVQKNLSNDSEQEKEKRKGYQQFQKSIEEGLKRVKKLEE